MSVRIPEVLCFKSFLIRAICRSRNRDYVVLFQLDVQRFCPFFYPLLYTFDNGNNDNIFSFNTETECILSQIFIHSLKDSQLKNKYVCTYIYNICKCIH